MQTKEKMWRCRECDSDSVHGGVNQNGRAHGIAGRCGGCGKEPADVYLADCHRDAGIWVLKWERPRQTSLWVYVDEFGLCTGMVKGWRDWEGQSIESLIHQMKADHPEMTLHRMQFQPVSPPKGDHD